MDSRCPVETHRRPKGRGQRKMRDYETATAACAWVVVVIGGADENDDDEGNASRDASGRK